MDIHMQKSVSVNQSRHRPYTLHKTNLRRSIDLNTKFRTIKLLEDDRKILMALGMVMMFYMHQRHDLGKKDLTNSQQPWSSILFPFS